MKKIFSCQRPGQRLSAQGLSARKQTDVPELTVFVTPGRKTYRDRRAVATIKFSHV
jgi:hypothetical protein